MVVAVEEAMLMMVLKMVAIGMVIVVMTLKDEASL